MCAERLQGQVAQGRAGRTHRGACGVHQRPAGYLHHKWGLTCCQPAVHRELVCRLCGACLVRSAPARMHARMHGPCGKMRCVRKRHATPHARKVPQRLRVGGKCQVLHGAAAAASKVLGTAAAGSCSGRISVFGEPTEQTRAAGKKGGEWVYASHDPANADEVTRGGGACLVLPYLLNRTLPRYVC